MRTLGLVLLFALITLIGALAAAPAGGNTWEEDTSLVEALPGCNDVPSAKPGVNCQDGSEDRYVQR